MNDAIRVKMAEEEGWGDVHVTADYQHRGFSAGLLVGTRKHGGLYILPEYSDDNDLDRFVRGMGRRHLIKYRVALYHVTKPTGQQVAESTELRMIVATVEQKQAAIIRAMGWEGVTV